MALPSNCNVCVPLVCEPDNLFPAGGVAALVDFSFVIECPPGFFCFTDKKTIKIGSDKIPPVKQPPPFGETITLRLQGCQSLIIRVLPANADPSQIAAAIAAMQAEWASQQAMCDFIDHKCIPGEVGCPDVPNPRIFPETTLDIVGSVFDPCVGSGYFAVLNAFGSLVSNVPFTWQIISGSLPPGLIGTVGTNTKEFFFTGTPTTSGSFTFLLRVTDSLGNFNQRPFTIRVIGITSGDPPEAIVGGAYSFQFTADGGTAPYTWSVTAGTLPDGLTLSSSGLLSGTPTTAQSSNFLVCVTSS